MMADDIVESQLADVLLRTAEQAEGNTFASRLAATVT
jgi:hypothetical protein